MRGLWLKVGLAMVSIGVLTTGCHRTFKGSAVQPNPLVSPVETLRESTKVVIVTGDMELNVPRMGDGSGGVLWVNQRYPLLNSAEFTIVSRDRLRFHVQFEHKWEDYADPSTWQAYLVDDKGVRYKPEAIDDGYKGHTTNMWDYERRSTQRNMYGDITRVNNDGHRRRVPLASMTLHRGQSDFVFYKRDIFTPDVRSLTLVLARRGISFQFTWKFVDDKKIVGSRATAKAAAVGTATPGSKARK